MQGFSRFKQRGKPTTNNNGPVAAATTEVSAAAAEVNDAPSRPATGVSAPPNFEMENDADNFSCNDESNFFDTFDGEDGDDDDNNIYGDEFGEEDMNMDVDMGLGLGMEEEQTEKQEAPPPSDKISKNPPFGGGGPGKGIFSRDRGLSKAKETGESSPSPPVLQHSPDVPSVAQEEEENRGDAVHPNDEAIMTANTCITTNTAVIEHNVEIEHNVMANDASMKQAVAAAPASEPTMECEAAVAAEAPMILEEEHNPAAPNISAIVNNESGAVYPNISNNNQDCRPQASENVQCIDNNLSADDSGGRPQPMIMTEEAEIQAQQMEVEMDRHPRASETLAIPTNEPEPQRNDNPSFSETSSDFQQPQMHLDQHPIPASEGPNSTQIDTIMPKELMKGALNSSSEEKVNDLPQGDESNEATGFVPASTETGISEASSANMIDEQPVCADRTTFSSTHPKPISAPPNAEGTMEALEENKSIMNQRRGLNTLSQEQMPPPFSVKPAQTHPTTTDANTEYSPTTRKQQPAAIVSPKPGVSGSTSSRNFSRIRNASEAPLVSPHHSTMAPKIPVQTMQQSARDMSQKSAVTSELLRRDTSGNRPEAQPRFLPSAYSKQSTASSKAQWMQMANQKKRASVNTMRSSKGPMPTSSRRPMETSRDQPPNVQHHATRESDQTKHLLQHRLNSEKLSRSLEIDNIQVDNFSHTDGAAEKNIRKEPVLQEGLNAEYGQVHLANTGKLYMDTSSSPLPVPESNVSYTSTTLPIADENFEDMLDRFTANFQEAVDRSNAFDIDLVELEVELGIFHSTALRYQGDMIDLLEAAEQLQSFGDSACQQ